MVVVACASSQAPLVFYKGPVASILAASNDRFFLSSVGSFKQVRFQSLVTMSSAWAFHIGSTATGFTDYSHNWRPNASGETVYGYLYTYFK